MSRGSTSMCTGKKARENFPYGNNKGVPRNQQQTSKRDKRRGKRGGSETSGG